MARRKSRKRASSKMLAHRRKFAAAARWCSKNRGSKKQSTCVSQKMKK